MHTHLFYCTATDEPEESPPDSTEQSSVLPQPVVPVVGTKQSQNSRQELKWDHKLNLIGRPVKDPLLHICEICSLPVLIYGRMVSVLCDFHVIPLRQ